MATHRGGAFVHEAETQWANQIFKAVQHLFLSASLILTHLCVAAAATPIRLFGIRLLLLVQQLPR